jgi:broad specificity phosphatase PhoE
MKLFNCSKPYQTIRPTIVVALCLLLAGLLSVPVTAAGEEKNPLADLKTGGHAALLRHALAPGVGDPENFSLGDCTSQRSLSDAGRRQAAEIGLKFREAGLVEAELYTSQWCRCIETARLMGFGEPVELPILNSFFREYSRQQSQTEQLIDWLSSKDLSRPVILVTHQVNITALSGVYPESGEIVLIQRKANGSFDVTARIQTGKIP